MSLPRSVAVLIHDVSPAKAPGVTRGANNGHRGAAPRPRLDFVSHAETNDSLDCSGTPFMQAPTGKPRRMATKTQRIRRIAGVAITAVKAIFRTGKAWGA